MGFHDVRFPLKYKLSARVMPAFDTVIKASLSQREERVARRSRPRRTYELSYRGDSLDDVAEVVRFFYARSGALHTFRFPDVSDYTSAVNGVDAGSSTDQEIGTGDGSRTVFQAVKRYVSGPVAHVRTIRLLEAGSVSVSLDDVTQSSGWTVNVTTGEITFSTAPGPGVSVKAGFTFDVHCRFSSESEKQFPLVCEDPQNQIVDGLKLVEVLDDLSDHDYGDMGGNRYVEASSDVALSIPEAKFYQIDATVTGLDCNLPDETDLSLGGAYFVVSNVGSTNTFRIIDHSGGIVKSAVGVGDSHELWLGRNSAGNKLWVAF